MPESPPETNSAMTMRDGLRRCRERGHQPRTIIDVGASNGMWTEMALEIYPDASCLLIEAQPPHEAALRSLKQRRPNVDFVMAAAGHRNGEIHFHAGDLFGGQASDQAFGEHDITVPVRTVDGLVAERRLEPPFLLKLDTHGFERPIFDGADDTLWRTELIVVEVYNFRLCDGCLRFHELCAFLEDRGFRCADICDVMRRPGDRLLWQCDFFFARADRPEFTRNAYS